MESEDQRKFLYGCKTRKQKTLLELGCGAGIDSLFFERKGLNVTAVDISAEMVRKCREKGLSAYELDFYDLSALNKKFDCIYALNSLLHVPKSDLRKILSGIDSVLESNGVFYLGLYGGDDSETDLKSSTCNISRLFVFYSEKYLKTVLKDYFEIVHFETLSVGEYIFHSVLLRKKQQLYV